MYRCEHCGAELRCTEEILCIHCAAAQIRALLASKEWMRVRGVCKGYHGTIAEDLRAELTSLYVQGASK